MYVHMHRLYTHIYIQTVHIYIPIDCTGTDTDTVHARLCMVVPLAAMLCCFLLQDACSDK